MKNFRQVEPWMRKGAEVILSNNTGTIKSMLTATLGSSISTETDGPVVLSLLIQPAGTHHFFTFNPNDVKPVEVATSGPKSPQLKERIPFPEHLG